MIKYLKQYADKTFEELVNGLIWFDLPLRLKAIFAKLPTGGGDSRPYKVYTALLTQTGTNAPTAVVLENTLGSDISYVRNEAGSYTISTSGIFLENKALLSISSSLNGGVVSSECYIGVFMDSLTTNSVDFTTINDLNTPLDEILLNTPIEIRVYN